MVLCACVLVVGGSAFMVRLLFVPSGRYVCGCRRCCRCGRYVPVYRGRLVSSRCCFVVCGNACVVYCSPRVQSACRPVVRAVVVLAVFDNGAVAVAAVVVPFPVVVWLVLVLMRVCCVLLLCVPFAVVRWWLFLQLTVVMRSDVVAHDAVPIAAFVMVPPVVVAMPRWRARGC